MTVLITILSILVTIYLLNILRFIIGLMQNEVKPSPTYINRSISVIVAVKNGEENIARLLEGLLSQKYNGDMEFIIVDDQSTDNTQKIIEKYSQENSSIRYVSSSTGNNILNHKKKALDAGIQASKYEHLLFTDIDCIIQSSWIQSMSKKFDLEADYIVGFTYVENRVTILNKFQRVDLLMLLFAAYASILLKRPWASSGQNQAYTKKLYYKLNGFETLAAYLQGDDTLFLQHARQSKAKIVFNNDPESYVISRSEKTWKSLLLQRARWSGDANVMWKFNIPFYITAFSTFITNLIIIIFLLLCLARYSLTIEYMNIFILLISLKIILEYIMYTIGNIKFKNQTYIIDFLVWSIIIAPYTCLMGIMSFFNFKWRS